MDTQKLSNILLLGGFATFLLGAFLFYLYKQRQKKSANKLLATGQSQTADTTPAIQHSTGARANSISRNKNKNDNSIRNRNINNNSSDAYLTADATADPDATTAANAKRIEQFKIKLMKTNLKTQWLNTISFPRSLKKMKPYYIHNMLSPILLVFFVASFITIIVQLIVNRESVGRSKNSNSGFGLFIPVFVYICSLNFLLMTRQHLYYTRRMHLNFNKQYLTQLLVIESTVLNSFSKKSVFNWIQLFALLLEFIQLASYPIREIIIFYHNLLSNFAASMAVDGNINTNINRNGGNAGLSGGGSLLPDIASIRGSFLTKSDSFNEFCVNLLMFFGSAQQEYFVVQFWIFFGFTLLCLLLLVITLKTNRFWNFAVFFAPVLSLLYLPILALFTCSSSCIANSLSPSATRQNLANVLTSPDNSGLESGSVFGYTFLKCNLPNLNMPFYLIASLLAYTVGYLLFTLVITSFDTIPAAGEIDFKSIGTAFTKNMAMIMSISFLLLPDRFYQLRIIAQVLLSIALLCFNIREMPSYVRSVNYWRSFSYSCILWLNLVSLAVSNNNIYQFENVFSVSLVFYLILLGFLFLFIVFILISKLN